jgi:hypothetical protein
MNKTTNGNGLADAIRQVLTYDGRPFGQGTVNLTQAIDEIDLGRVANAIQELAGAPIMGTDKDAIERGLGAIADAIHHLAEAIEARSEVG